MVKRRVTLCLAIFTCVSVVGCSASLSQKAKRDLECGDEALGGERYSAAVESYSEYLKKYPNDAGVHLKCGQAYLKSGNLKTAIDEFKRSISLDPENEEARAFIKESIFNESLKFSEQGEELTSMRYL